MSFTRSILLSSPTSSISTNSAASTSTPQAQGCLHMLQNVMSGLVRPSVQLCVPRTSRSLSPVPPRSGSNALTRTASDRSPLQRTMSNSGTHSKTIPLASTLTPSQVQSIRRSWKHINTKGLTNVTKGCFQKLESSNAAVAKIFRSHSTLQISTSNVRNIMEHTKFMLSMMDRIVDGENGIDYELRKIGAAHAKLAEEYGMGTVELERFGEILVDAFSKLDGVRQSKETSKAWRILIASIIDNVRVGFDTELRVQRRKASFSTISRSSDRRRSMPSPRNLSVTLTTTCTFSRKLSQI